RVGGPLHAPPGGALARAERIGDPLHRSRGVPEGRDRGRPDQTGDGVAPSMSAIDGVLESFHRVLVEEITSKRPEYLQGPFTVAEIYQDLVPYSTHRDRIGVDINGDYEDALIRLLAGEGGYLVLESEHALRDLRRELDTSNPNTGVYREFAAVDVRLDPARAGRTGPAANGAEGGASSVVAEEQDQNSAD